MLLVPHNRISKYISAKDLNLFRLFYNILSLSDTIINMYVLYKLDKMFYH